MGHGFTFGKSPEGIKILRMMDGKMMSDPDTMGIQYDQHILGLLGTHQHNVDLDDMCHDQATWNSWGVGHSSHESCGEGADHRPGPWPSSMTFHSADTIFFWDSSCLEKKNG